MSRRARARETHCTAPVIGDEVVDEHGEAEDEVVEEVGEAEDVGESIEGEVGEEDEEAVDVEETVEEPDEEPLEEIEEEPFLPNISGNENIRRPNQNQEFSLEEARAFLLIGMIPGNEPAVAALGGLGDLVETAINRLEELHMMQTQIIELGEAAIEQLVAQFVGLYIYFSVNSNFN